MASAHRQFSLTIWGLAFGYFIFYAPYLAFIKIISTGLWPGVSGPVSGFRLLPGVVISTAVVLPIIVWRLGWWKYASRRQVFGLSIPFPRPLVFLSGFGTAIIIGTTTLIFTFPGISIVFALVLMRGGVLIMGPVVDRLFKRRVRWFSWAAFAVTLPAILIALADINNYHLSIVTATIIIAYLSGYLLRIPCATKLAKSADTMITYRYFVEEQMVAMLFLVAIPAVFALIGKGEFMVELRHGFTGFFTSSITFPALIVGAFYACLYCFGTLIYLDCRENTYCIPLNRGSSLLAGFFASYVLTLFFGLKLPSAAQLGSAGLLVTALLLLSPFHHVLERSLGKLKLSLAGVSRTLLDFATGFGKREPVVQRSRQSLGADNPPPTQAGVAEQEQFDKLRQIFLFVCSGNTCRSPMAAAIGNAEIATRLNVPVEALGSTRVQAQSAGLSARAGAPMTPEAQQTLRLLGVPVVPHIARSLTVELAHQVERIFCMTQDHRTAVINMFPSAAGKTQCLDPNGDIEDPIGRGMEAYASCAERIHDLVRSRLDEIGLQHG
jgi:protein-tyrosine-phosphatase